MKWICFLIFTCLSLEKSVCQTIITGTVTDLENENLPGATVMLKGAAVGVVTDNNGEYTISLQEPRGMLVFSFVGMETQEVDITGRKVIDVVLRPKENSLDEVVVIGYGAQSRSTVTTAITKVDSKALESVPYSNVASALQGTVSGVRVQSINGQPGAAPRVIVRGGTSINNPNGASPLYIIDGVIRTNLNGINPDDIASMQVLKDAAATAIYGARGSNGVVIVTTKSGKAGESNVTYKYNLIRSEVGKTMGFMSARDFIYFQRLGVSDDNGLNGHPLTLLTAANSFGTGNDLSNMTVFTPQYLTAENEHKLNEGWQSMPDPVDPAKTIIFQETDWNDVLFKTAISHNHALSVSGGSEKASFYAGIGYLINDGIVLHSNYKRISLNLNGDLQVSDRLNVSGQLLYSNSGSNTVVGNPFYRTMGAAPTMKYKYEDGTLAPGKGTTMFNPEYQVGRRDDKSSIDNLTMTLQGRWDILPGLRFEPQVSLYKRSADSRSFQKSAYLTGPTTINDARSASGSYSKQTQYQADGVFTYSASFAQRHNLEAKGGFSYFGTSNASLSAWGRGAASDLVPTLNAAAEPVSVSGSESDMIILGYFSRINYDFAQKYLFSLSARYDGASNLGNSHKWGFFPGVSAGWNMHRENFWTIPAKYLSSFKLRGSYGVNGNISGLGPYQFQGQYSVGRRYAGEAAIQNTVLANQDLKWEQSKTYDIGADIGILNNRISILFDYYRRVTSNLLTNMTLPHSTGFGSILTNLGSLENKGVELEINANILPSSSPFQWNMSFNASKVQNKILKLPYNGVENNRIGGIYVWDPKRGDYAWLGGLEEGGTMGDLYAYKQVSIFSTDEEASDAPVDMIMTGGDRTKYGGDVNWLDTDDNGIIDARDRAYVGNQYPVWTGGFSNTFSYKNIDLYLRMDYTTGHTIYNYLLVEHIAQTHGDNALSALVLDSWQNQGDITDIPRYLWFDRHRRSLHRGNSEYYEKGDFLALREVTLSYTFPQNLIKRVRLSNLRLYITANNLHYFTKYRGLSPEDGSRDVGRYPVPKTILFGASVSF